MSKPIVSVIVPTKNSSQFLEACLQSIKDQTYKNIEVIVVDNSSTDNTQEIAKKFTDKVYTKGPERCAQRNFGAAQATGEYVVFIDSDMVLSKEVVSSCVAKITANANIKGIIIPEESFGEGFWAQCKKLERSFYVGIDWMEAARFFSTSVFNEVGGYDEGLISGEDWDISQRINKFGPLGRVAEFIYHNEGQPKFFRSINKKYYYAKQFKKYYDGHKGDKNLSNQTSLIKRYALFFSKPKLIVLHPVLFVGMLLLKTGEFAFGGFGYLFNSKKEIIAKDSKEMPDGELPFISFILPTYNAEKYLQRCLESVFTQDYPSNLFEVLVADGGSSDNTISILQKFPIKLFSNPNKDSDFGKYLLLKEAKGELFLFLDSDNIVADKKWLKKMVYPFLDLPELMSCESNYLIANDFTSINTYASLLVIVDPLARLLASRPSKKIRYDGYIVKTYNKGSSPVAGANGFMWRKSEVIPYLNNINRRFAETNLLNKICVKKEVTIANIPRVGIYHYYCESVLDYSRKRTKIATKHLGRIRLGDKTWVEKRNKYIFLFSVIYLVTFIGPFFESIYKSIIDRRIEWLWHPFISFFTIIIYCKNYFKFKLS